MHSQEHAVPAGRLAQPIDLLAQRQQLLAGFLEGVHQLGIAGGQGIDAGFEQLRVTARGLLSAGVVQLLAQDRRLPAKLFQLGSIIAVVVETPGAIRLTHNGSFSALHRSW